MKLAVRLSYWEGDPTPDALDRTLMAESLGFDSVWTAEAYGSDCFTPLAWMGSATKNIKLGTCVAQIPARSPAATAMTAMTFDHLSGGRFILGVGVSGPQVTEGWHGELFTKPLERTREYVEIVRRIIARKEPVEFQGKHYQLPRLDGTGLGKPLKSMVHPLRTEIPIYLGAEGPKNIALAAEIGDGWLPVFFAPARDAWYREQLAEGFARPSSRHTAADFEIVGQVPIFIGDDIEECADRYRPALALYVGGMGARSANFHFDSFVRLGYEADCQKVQDLYLRGRKQEAAAAIPTAMVEEVALIGPPSKIADEVGRWKDTVLTTMLIWGSADDLKVMAELIG